LWLKGSSDRDNLRADLYALLTGTMAAGQRGGGQAGNGAQVAGTDAWTALDGTNFVIRSKREEDPFEGEYVMRRGIPRFAPRTLSTVISNIGNPTFSGAYSLGTTRVWFALFVSTTNTSPGNLTGTVVTYDVRNADTGASVASGTVTGWSGSSDTRAIGATGVSIGLTLGGSDQFIAGANAILWLRGYTTTYTQGIDFFPEAAKVTTAGVTVSNSSGGSANYTGGGTDYTLVQELHQHPVTADGTALAWFSTQLDWGGNGCGCGIAWNAGGSPPAVGATYYIPATYKVYGAYYQVPALTVLSSDLWLTHAPMDAWDATLQVGRFVMQQTTGTTGPKITVNSTQGFGRVFTGSSQAGSTFINFWISVKSDKIVVILRGDPGQSGLTVFYTLQRYTPLVNTDTWPWVFLCSTPNPATANFGVGALHVTSKYTYEQPYYANPANAAGGGGSFTFTAAQLSQAMWQVALTSAVDQPVVAGIGSSMPVQNPNNFNLTWWLYSVYVRRGRGGSNLVGSFDPSKPSAIRGKLQGVFSLATDNFTSLDELADNSGTYLLVTPSSALGSGAASESYGSLAILEE